MNALEWLKRRHAASEENRRRTKFESVPASQAWGGYVDKPGGQQLMVRQPVARQPEVDNTLTVKDDGTQTLVKKWKDSGIKSWGIGGREGQLVDRLDIQASGIGQRPTVSATGALSPEAQAAIAQVQATGGQNVDAYGDTIGPVRRPPQSIREVASGYARQPRTPVLPNAWQDAMRHRTYNPDIYQMSAPTPRPSPQTIRGIASGYARQPRPITPEVVRASESAPRETWGGDLKLTMPQDPITRGWIQDPATILNIGNLIKKMGGTIDYMKCIDDRIKENRDRRFRMFNSDPYSPVRKY